MPEAYIIDAARTPVGRRRGALAAAHPVDLAAHVIGALVERNGVDPASVDDVILGCLDNIGPQAGDIARTAALAAGLPETVPGVTIDRQCGILATGCTFRRAGRDERHRRPHRRGRGAEHEPDPTDVVGHRGRGVRRARPLLGLDEVAGRYGDETISQFRGAEMIAEKWGIDREAMEQYALESHRRALQAIAGGRFAAEILPYQQMTTDEGPRADTTPEKMAALPSLTPGGRLSAAVASQISDGASGMLIASAEAVRRHDLAPRARIHHLTVLGADPVMMLAAPIPATERALERTGMRIDDFDVFEVNEAFAPVVMAWLQETGADPERVNPNGGAIALGHPIGATGTRLMTTMLHELERSGGRYGLQTMCEGGGQANVTIIERLG